MLKVEVHKRAPHEYEIRCELPKEQYEQAADEVARALQRRARIPGFRPGRAPLSEIKRLYGAEVHEQASERLVRDHYAAAIEQAGVKPAVQPAIAVPDTPPTDAFTFVLHVAEWPKAKLPPLDELEVDLVEVEVRDRDVEAVLARLREEERRYEPAPDRAAEEGDRVIVDIAAEADGEPIEALRAEEEAIVLGSGAYLPAVENALKGARAGESRTAEIAFPKDAKNKELAGKRVRLHLLVKRVEEPKPYPDDEALAKGLGFESLEALKADIRRRLEAEADRENAARRRAAVVAALRAQAELSVPQALITEEARARIQRLVQSLRAQGVAFDPEALRSQAFIEQVRAEAEAAIAAQVLLEAVAEAAGLEVSDEELNEEIERLVAAYPDAEREKARQYWNQEARREGLRAELLERKAVEHVLARAKVNIKRISIEEAQAKDEEERA